MVPAAQVFQVGQFCFSVEEIVSDYAVEIVIDEKRTIGQQEWRRCQRVIDRHQQLGELSGEVLAVAGPFLEATFSKLPFLVADQHDLFYERA